MLASVLLLGSLPVPLTAAATEDPIQPEATAPVLLAETEPTEGTTAPTEGTTAPTEETSEPTEGTTAPTEETEEATEETTPETTGETEPEETEAEEPEGVSLDEIYEETAAKLQSRTPGTGSIGGEWLVLGLARAGKLTDAQKEAYLEAAKAYIEKKYNDAGQLHVYKPTENERLALALTAVGQDPAAFEGFDLLKALQDTAWTVSQGNNAAAFALLAYRAAGYEASNSDALIQTLLDNQNSSGGWAITTGGSDSDTTAMAVQALAPYYSRPAVKAAVDRAVSWLSGLVNDRGQIKAGGYEPSAENTAQVIVALTELGIDPAGDSRFIRNGKSLMDGLASFYVEDGGGFAHQGNTDYNQMATEQAFYALAACYRLLEGKNSLYDMSDVVRDGNAVKTVEALISAIGEVTADSGPAVAAARSAYDALTEFQKGQVGNFAVLTEAETAYAGLSKTVEDEKAANAVQEKISAIGSTVTLNSEKAITAARKAYNALTAAQKTLVKNYKTLTAAEASLKQVKDGEAAGKVEDLIKAIGTVTLNSETAIKKARSGYDALTAEQKKLVENYKVLQSAESKLKELKSTVSVQFTLLGCYAHGEGETEVHTLADGNLSAWISRKTCKVTPGATVRDVLENALTQAGLSWENPTGNYVEAIDGIGEFTNGKNSGWMYTLNGTHPNLGVDQQKVQNGDVIVFHYTDDYTREESSRQFQDSRTDTTEPEETAKQQIPSKAQEQTEDAYRVTGDYLETLGTPTVGSIGGEWMVIGLARSGRDVPEAYYDHALAYVQENLDENGRLHRAKSTDNSRLILALTAIGRDASDAEGYDLLSGLADLDYVCRQGINGPIWALIAFDSGNYPVPEGNVTRENLIGTILSAQLSDGGWALSGETADPDMTGMALQALAPYCDINSSAAEAVENALAALSQMQDADGGYSGVDGPSSESIAQVIVALSALGIDADTDERFVKNGVSMLDALLSYYVEGGGFRHIPGGELDGMATEQAYYALTAYYRMLDGDTSLYAMTDMIDMGGDISPEEPAKAVQSASTPAEAEPEENGGSSRWWILLPVLGAAAVLLLRKKSAAPEDGA